jgi:hypothetical protein
LSTAAASSPTAATPEIELLIPLSATSGDDDNDDDNTLSCLWEATIKAERHNRMACSASLHFPFKAAFSQRLCRVGTHVLVTPFNLATQSLKVDKFCPNNNSDCCLALTASSTFEVAASSTDSACCNDKGVERRWRLLLLPPPLPPPKLKLNASMATAARTSFSHAWTASVAKDKELHKKSKEKQSKSNRKDTYKKGG